MLLEQIAPDGRYYRGGWRFYEVDPRLGVVTPYYAKPTDLRTEPFHDGDCFYVVDRLDNLLEFLTGCQLPSASVIAFVAVDGPAKHERFGVRADPAGTHCVYGNGRVIAPVFIRPKAARFVDVPAIHVETWDSLRDWPQPVPGDAATA